MSLFFAVTAIAFSIVYYKRSRYAAIGVAYFGLMELIQFFQYGVIDNCNDVNKNLTILGYLHICFQPLFFNIWLFAFVKRPNFVFLYMSIIAGVLMASRLFVPGDMLCDTRHEPLCGENTCSVSGTYHIAWNVRMRSAGSFYFTPSISLHFFMFVVPALVTFQLKPFIAMLLSMPYLAMITHNKNEQPAIWCYTSVVQLLVTYFYL